MPASVRSEVGEIGLIETDDPSPGIKAADVFTTSRAELTGELNRLRHAIAPHGFVWISLPKKRRMSQPTSPKTRSAKSRCRWTKSTSKSARSTPYGRDSSQ
jgi:hypothetical protein